MSKLRDAFKRLTDKYGVEGAGVIVSLTALTTVIAPLVNKDPESQKAAAECYAELIHSLAGVLGVKDRDAFRNEVADAIKDMTYAAQVEMLAEGVS